MKSFKGRMLTAGLGLAVAALWAVAHPLNITAEAADFGNDTYRADDNGHRAGTKLRGRGHTFDVDPPRHPQTVTPQRKSYKDLDQYAYRDDVETDRGYYEDDPSSAYRGSLKDDPVGPDQNYGRWNDDERWRHRRNYSERWDEPDRCLARREIRRKLRRAGWRGMRFDRMRGNIGYVEARQRRTGEIYELAVDNCTGEVISAACIGAGDRGFRRRGVRFDDYRDDVVIRW